MNHSHASNIFLKSMYRINATSHKAHTHTRKFIDQKRKEERERAAKNATRKKSEREQWKKRGWIHVRHVSQGNHSGILRYLYIVLSHESDMLPITTTWIMQRKEGSFIMLDRAHFTHIRTQKNRNTLHQTARNEYQNRDTYRNKIGKAVRFQCKHWAEQFFLFSVIFVWYCIQLSVSLLFFFYSTSVARIDLLSFYFIL